MVGLHPSRESVTTIRNDGSREYLYPADVAGRFTRARKFVALALLGVYALLPWIKVGGYPAVFLDVEARRFHLFGLTLAAQDAWVLFFLITGLGFALFFVTALYGRIWCGWACPHTVFLEHVYRRIERWIEGDAVRRRSLAAAPWGPGKIARRVVKHAGYFIVSLAITHLLLAYFISIPALWGMVRQEPGRHWFAFVFVSLATGVVYFNFAWFREQLCIIICPYGRLQSALTDENTMVIGYDAARGEPRGPVGSTAAGHCIDCDRCVRVCPTGIDIRQGLQMECVGCAACIDACDEVMRRLGRPTGLVRYDSLAGLAGRANRFWRPRIAIYLALLVLGSGVATWSISAIRPTLVGVTRMVGAPYYVDGGVVRDQYLIRLTNKRSHPVSLRISVLGLPAGSYSRGAENAVEIPAIGEEVRPLIIEQSRTAFRGTFAFVVQAQDEGGRPIASRSIEFLGPTTDGKSP
jgi:cytochrome c oxidase accessory protein FixG